MLTRTIPSQYQQLGAHGILESLKVPQPPPPLRIPRSRHNFTTQIFWDSDVGKWIEAASYALSHRRDAKIEAEIDEITDWLAAAQLPDGYLNCWYIGREIDNRWTNLRDNHELYCAGHMLEGAIAYFLATGRRRLLDIMEEYVDHIASVFGPGPDQKHGYPGHQEIELALIKLYHLTGDRRRLDLAAYFINERGRAPHYFDVEAKARGESPEILLGEDLRIQPVAQAGARAGEGCRPCRPRHVHVCGDGRSRRRSRRRCAEARMRSAVGGCDRAAHVRDRRPRAGGGERRLHHSTTTFRTTPPMPKPAPPSR